MDDNLDLIGSRLYTYVRRGVVGVLAFSAFLAASSYVLSRKEVVGVSESVVSLDERVAALDSAVVVQGGRLDHVEHKVDALIERLYGNGEQGVEVRDDMPLRQDVQDVSAFIELWRSSWEDGDLGVYVSLYSSDALIHVYGQDRFVDRYEWAEIKDQLNMRDNWRIVGVNELSVENVGNFTRVLLDQKYASSSYQDRGIKELVLMNTAQGPRIVYESFHKR